MDGVLSHWVRSRGRSPDRSSCRLRLDGQWAHPYRLADLEIHGRSILRGTDIGLSEDHRRGRIDLRSDPPQDSVEDCAALECQPKGLSSSEHRRGFSGYSEADHRSVCADQSEYRSTCRHHLAGFYISLGDASSQRRTNHGARAAAFELCLEGLMLLDSRLRAIERRLRDLALGLQALEVLSREDVDESLTAGQGSFCAPKHGSRAALLGLCRRKSGRGTPLLVPELSVFDDRQDISVVDCVTGPGGHFSQHPSSLGGHIDDSSGNHDSSEGGDRVVAGGGNEGCRGWCLGWSRSMGWVVVGRRASDQSQ